MYPQFMKITQSIYEKVTQHYGGEDREYYILQLNNAFRNFKIDVQGERDANIAYPLIKCLEEIDPITARAVKQLEDSINQRDFSIYNNFEAFCQFHFHTSSHRLEDTLKMLEDHWQACGGAENGAVQFSNPDLLPAIQEIVQIRTDYIKNNFDEYISRKNRGEDISYSSEKLKTLSESLAQFGADLQDLCDAVEVSLRNNFVAGLNSATQKTVEEIKQNPSCIKVFDGQPFNFLIHSAVDTARLLDRPNPNVGSSYSLIDEKNIWGYLPTETKFAFYTPVENHQMGFANTYDNSSIYDEENQIWQRFMPSDYIGIDAFKEKTRNRAGQMAYSEIGLNSPLQPDAIICYDGATQEEVALANKYGLDVILIKTDCYPNMKIQNTILEPKYKELRSPENLNKLNQTKEIKLER